MSKVEKRDPQFEDILEIKEYVKLINLKTKALKILEHYLKITWRRISTFRNQTLISLDPLVI